MENKPVKLLCHFNLNVLDPIQICDGISVIITKLSLKEARELIKEGFESFVGKKPMVTFVSEVLGVPVPYKFIKPELVIGDVVLHCQYLGYPYDDNCDNVPKGAKMDFYKIEIF
jgi:hypothetical protein